MLLCLLAGGFCIAFVVAWGLNWLALRSWRRSAGFHWTERARRLYPARASAGANIWLIPVSCLLAAQLVFTEASSHWLLVGAATWMGTILGTFPFDNEIRPWLRFREWLSHVIVSWLVRFAWWTVLLLAIWFMPDEMGWTGWTMALLTLAFMLALSFGLWTRMLSWVRILKPPGERLGHIVSETAKRLKVPECRVWLFDAPVSYAAALPLSRELMFSQRLLDLHPDGEVAAICAHEFAHLAESRMINLIRLMGSLTFFPWIFTRPAFHAWEVGGIFWISVVSALLFVFNRRLSRNVEMEIRADQFAQTHQGEEGTYARALERLYETEQLPAVMPGERQTHPHLYDRMLEAGITPDYDRPVAPETSTWIYRFMIIVLIILAICRTVSAAN